MPTIAIFGGDSRRIMNQFSDIPRHITLKFYSSYKYDRTSSARLTRYMGTYDHVVFMTKWLSHNEFDMALKRAKKQNIPTRVFGTGTGAAAVKSWLVYTFVDSAVSAEPGRIEAGAKLVKTGGGRRLLYEDKANPTGAPLTATEKKLRADGWLLLVEGATLEGMTPGGFAKKAQKETQGWKLLRVSRGAGAGRPSTRSWVLKIPTRSRTHTMRPDGKWVPFVQPGHIVGCTGPLDENCACGPSAPTIGEPTIPEPLHEERDRLHKEAEAAMDLADSAAARADKAEAKLQERQTFIVGLQDDLHSVQKDYRELDATCARLGAAYEAALVEKGTGGVTMAALETTFDWWVDRLSLSVANVIRTALTNAHAMISEHDVNALKKALNISDD